MMHKVKNSLWKVLVILLIGSLLLTGCGKNPNTPENTKPQGEKKPKPTAVQETEAATEPATELASVPVIELATEPITEPFQMEYDPTLTSFRQAMIGTPELFAVAYFGYHESQDMQIPVDPHKILKERACWLCEDLPFLLQIPEENIVGEWGDLYCIVPLDEDATVAVNRGVWDDSTGQTLYDEVIYRSECGDPILLFCNGSGWEPDTQLSITGPSGEVVWYPALNDMTCPEPLLNDNWEEQFYDFTPYRELLMADHRQMKDMGWKLPTAEMLIGNAWGWYGYLKDGREVSYQVTFHEDTIFVRWNDGIDQEDHVYPDARWELTYDEGFAVLAIDFREFAGIMRYNLLYDARFNELYVGLDTVAEEMNIGWEPLSRFLVSVNPDAAD